MGNKDWFIFGRPVKFIPDGGWFIPVLLNEGYCMVPFRVMLLVVEVSEKDAKV
jgi:hypothetical protein